MRKSVQGGLSSVEFASNIFTQKSLFMIFFRVFRHFKVSGSGYLLVSPHLIDAFQIKGRGGEKKSLSFAFAVTLFWIIVFNIGGTHRGIHLQLGYTNKYLLQNITFSAISDFVAFAVCVPLY